MAAKVRPARIPVIDAEGRRFPRGDYLDAVYIEKERRIACRFRLRSELVLWPLHLERAEYYAAPAPLHALGLDVAPDVVAGMRLGFRRLSAQPGVEKRDDGKPDPVVKDIRVDELPIHILGSTNDSVSVYEQLFAATRRITIRYLDSFGDARFLSAPLDMLEQIGFGDNLGEDDDRVFSGFNLLLDFFAFPDKFLGFRLKGLRSLLARIDAPAFEVIFEFGSAVPRLQSVVRAEMFALYAVPIVNQFEMNCSRVPIRRKEHEHHVVPDRSRTLDFEAHQIVDVFAHYPGRKEKVPVFPLYSQPTENVRSSDALYYTARRLPRRRTSEERRSGAQSAYAGTELYISLYEPVTLDERDRVRELSVRCLASNRHLADQLPVGEAGADFNLVEDTSIPLRCAFTWCSTTSRWPLSPTPRRVTTSTTSSRTTCVWPARLTRRPAQGARSMTSPGCSSSRAISCAASTLAAASLARAAGSWRVSCTTGLHWPQTPYSPARRAASPLRPMAQLPRSYLPAAPSPGSCSTHREPPSSVSATGSPSNRARCASAPPATVSANWTRPAITPRKLPPRP